MKQMPCYLRTVALSLGLGALFTSACDVSLKDPNAASERNKVELATWTSTPGSSTYSYSKCTADSASDLATHICGTRLDGSSNSTAYNWHTNCSGSGCGTVHVAAYYMLTENLGPQTLHVEAFDNASFTNAPVSSLEIAGFDASKPSSTNFEELYLAPGEYYFRAYLTQGTAAPLPYSLQGMELVSDAPIGVWGALSGAQRVLVKSAGAVMDPVVIKIDQLFKKAQAPEDTLAKFRLQITLSDTAASVEKFRNIHILLLKAPDLELVPTYDFTLSSNNLLATGLNTDFVSPSLTPESYYVFAYVDANSNGFVDAGELSGFIQDAGKPSLVLIDKNKTKSLSVSLAPFIKL
ncbi:MAG: hypothetical protein H7249_04935 [Chitinophagaceae bacterium]|nr:hypothetical protein [Oligoflexus sp.]